MLNATDVVILYAVTFLAIIGLGVLVGIIGSWIIDRWGK